MADSLFQDFPPLSREDWLRQVEADLKNKSPETLKWSHEDGFQLFPILTAEDVQQIPQGMPSRGIGGNPWILHHDFVMREPSDVVGLLSGDDGFSVESVGLVLGGEMRRHECSPWPYYHWSPGIEAKDMATLKLLVNAIRPGVEIHVSAGMGAYPVYAALQQILAESGRNLSEVRGGIDNDPFRFLMKCGTLPFGEATSFDTCAAIVRHASQHLPGFRGLQVNTEPVALAGGTPAQEVALALSMAVEYITQLGNRGLSTASILSQIHFIFASGSDFFGEIAKLRAFRRLWDRILTGYGIGDAPKLHLRSKTSGYTLSHLDPHVNLLRATTQAMSAVIGGADSVSVAEYNQVYAEDLRSSARIARNIQLLLRHESHLGTVADAAGGAYYPEQLTAALEEKAWALFLEWEANGGFLAAYKDASIQQLVWASSENKESRILTGRDKWIGVNQFPNANEESAHLLQMDAMSYGSAMPPADPEVQGIIANAGDEGVSQMAAYLAKGVPFSLVVDTLLDENREAVPMLPGKRASHDFEMVRRTTESYVMVEGTRPTVMLYKFGAPAMRRARAAFASNLFAVGGFAIRETDSLQEVMQAGAAVVVFCSDDASYPAEVPGLLAQISHSHPETLLVLAGKPEGSDEWLRQGLHSRIHAGMEIPSYLVNVQRKLRML